MKELIRWADGSTLVLPDNDREWDTLVSPNRQAGGWETRLASKWQTARITPLVLSELGLPIGSISVGSAVDGGAMVHTETPSPDINASTRRRHKSVRRKAAWLITALRAAGIGVNTLYFFVGTFSDSDRAALFQASTREEGSFCPELEAYLLLGILPPELARQQPPNHG
jgi:hypothetical protein